jgi:hypothetical protein
MPASEKLNAKLAALTTDQLLEISLRLTLATDVESMIVCNRAERELAKRMTEAEFVAHMEVCETLLDAAA